MKLLVARTARAQGELVDAVSGEARVGVAIDQPGDRAEAASVELLDLTLDRTEVAHAADRLDGVTRAEEITVLDHLDVGEGRAAQRRRRAGWGRELFEIADEQAARGARRAHPASGGIGGSSPCASAASIASG